MREVGINLKVKLDDSHVPERIEWTSDDPPASGQWSDAKGFFLSVFDKKSLETLKIDLWDKELEVGEMNRLCYFTLKGMADSYFKATNNADIANDMRRFAQYFGEEAGVIPKPKPEQ